MPVAARVTSSPATGAPTTGGTAQVGETLTAGTSDTNDQDGLTNVSHNYQWRADDKDIDTDIDGATGSGPTLAAGERGQRIQVRVTFSDDGESEESLNSAVAVTGAAGPVPLTAGGPGRQGAGAARGSRGTWREAGGGRSRWKRTARARNTEYGTRTTDHGPRTMDHGSGQERRGRYSHGARQTNSCTGDGGGCN